MIYKRLLITFVSAVCIFGCGREASDAPSAAAPSALSQVPAVRLSFRYEADVPGPETTSAPSIEERNAAIQADFDQNRPQEILDRTLTSPDKKRIAAVYHRVTDLPEESRLDMYTAEGKAIKKITPETMAVHFPDTIRWAPDSSALAFVAILRTARDEGSVPPPVPDAAVTPAPPATPEPDANANVEGQPAPAETPAPAEGVLTFRTEQIYMCDSDGTQLKPLTQSEGKIYFYYAWSPDSTKLAALVTTMPEWRAMTAQAEGKGEVLVPAGRPRIVEKNGRERLLDDYMTQVRPVWSPDSTKVAAAFETQVRIYDALGTTPTQAAIPLRNQLLISSDAYERELQKQADAEPGAANEQQTPTNSNATPAATTLPDPTKLVSFNPIVVLEWRADDILYFQTGYVRSYKNAVDNRSSYMRWHRLIFSPSAK